MVEFKKDRGWENLHPLSKELYQVTYFKPNQNYTEWLESVTVKYANDADHA